MTTAATDPSWVTARDRLRDFAALNGFEVNTDDASHVVVDDGHGHSAAITWFDDNTARITTGLVVSAVVGLDEEDDRASVLVDFVQAVVQGRGREATVPGTADTGVDVEAGVWDVTGIFGA